MRFARGIMLVYAWRAGLVGAAVAASLLTTPPAAAQSAADKATARTLATEGIKAFQAGGYADALDKLQRAQSLYEAPIHLLYIARAQVKLDKLVEGAETYRKLSRIQLEAGAAAPQKQAVESGTQELTELEPKLPTLRLDVDPPNLTSLEIRIDSERVPPAAVGVERPTNPGQHKVQAWAPGYNAVEVAVDLRVGDKKAVPLRLEAGQNAPPGFVPSAAPEQQQPRPNAPAPDQPPAADEGTIRPGIGFLVGLRAGAAIPTGDVGVPVVPDSSVVYSDSQSVGEFVKPGGGLELRAGVRFAKYFTGLVYFGRYVLKPGQFWTDLVDQQPSTVQADNTAFAQEAGFGFMVAGTPGKFGPYGEVDVSLYRQFQVQQAVTSQNRGCDVTWKMSSPGVRLVGGVQIPVGRLFHLSPYAGVSAGKTADKWQASWSGDDACRYVPESITVEDPKSNAMFVIGVGGDFLFGKDRAR